MVIPSFSDSLREGITRRCLLQRSARNFVGIGLGGMLSALGGKSAFAGAGSAQQGKHFGRAKNVLVILEQGGLSHMDTWDPKPDAPSEHRSIFKPISTNVPGMQFTELLAKTAKVADKLGVLKALAKVADSIIVGGGMAFTFLGAQGRSIGGSLFDASRLDDCAALLGGHAKILLPTDIVALSPGSSFGPGETSGDVNTFTGDLPEGWVGLDIGAQSAASFASVIANAGTVLWNGPMGAFEDERFALGTRAVGAAVASCGGNSVVGGGDSCRAIEEMGLVDQISFMSTGGGASLEFLEFGDLPGLAALRHAPNAPRS
jgi:hypothetical protein